MTKYSLLIKGVTGPLIRSERDTCQSEGHLSVVKRGHFGGTCKSVGVWPLPIIHVRTTKLSRHTTCVYTPVVLTPSLWFC